MSPLPQKSKLRVPGLLGVLTVIFNWKILFTSRRMIPWDAVDFFYPFLGFVHEELRHFRFPLWNSYSMSGFPIVADPEAQIFYPPNWLFVLLHPFGPLPYRLVEIQIVFHFFLAGLFMYYLARTFVKSDAPAIVAALLYEFGGTMAVHAEHMASIESMAWYPLVLLLARRGLLEGRFFLTASAGAAFGMQILTGHAQHTVYLGLMLFLYFGYEACFGADRRSLWPRWILSLVVIASVGAGLAMIQLIPSAELARHSIRSYLIEMDVIGGTDPRSLWTLFLPAVNGGISGLPQRFPFEITFGYLFLTVPGCLLALIGIVESLRRRNFYWPVVILLTAELSLGHHHYLGRYLFRIPLLNLFRNAGAFFDLTHFALCLMAAVGADALFSSSLSGWLRKHFVNVLAAILIAAIALGEFLFLRDSVNGWYGMLAVFAVFVLSAAAFLQGRIGAPICHWVCFGLIGFQLVYYDMDQHFNSALENPDLYLTQDIAASSKKTISFFRSDPVQDFRFGAVAEPMYSGNGSNLFRIPGIYGWNPVTLRKYDEYVRGFSNSGSYVLPYGGHDHNFNSSMLDLLGTKYLLLVDNDFQKKLEIDRSEKFKLAFDEFGYWKTYRNANYLSRAWFFPKAMAVPDGEVSVGLMASNWFDGRRHLIIEKTAMPGGLEGHSEDMPLITLNADRIDAVSSGFKMVDPYCASVMSMLGGWAEKKDDWLQYDFAGPEKAGRYLLIAKYTAAYSPAPTLKIEVKGGDSLQESGPFALPGTSQWRCDRSRTADLGVFELKPGKIRMTVSSLVPSDMHLYKFWLVRLPPFEFETAANFSFSNFSVSANAISFDAKLPQDGFVLLNEIDYPSWSAKVDGRPAEIIPADHIFRSLYVGAGAHRIEFRFWPRHFAIGAAISVVTLCACFWFAIGERRKRLRASRDRISPN